MCGISGLFNIDGSAVDETLIQKMNDSQIHRGPDAEGVWIDNNIGFGHRELKCRLIKQSEINYGY